MVIDNKGSYEHIRSFQSPSEENEQDLKDKMIPIRFDYSIFQKGARFIGASEEALELGLVSFKDIELSNLQFHNVKWQEKREILFFTRMAIIDEMMLGKDKNKNYGEVSQTINI